MRYTLFFPSSLLPLPSSQLTAPNAPRVAYGLSPCSEVPKTQRFAPHGYKNCYNNAT
ncbi:MAG: hypothetical protein F6K55_36315 [Moorea sp. SIO4A3]|nr:hypothetical protein [Moorena sp. SIO4A3]